VATQFLQATNKKTGLKSMQDTDHLLRLFVSLARRNAKTGETMDDWDFDLLDGRCIVIQSNYNWKKVHVSVKLGDLFK
jgi:hypothetical protein